MHLPSDITRTDVLLCLRAHHPWLLQNHRLFHTHSIHGYFDEKSSRLLTRKLARDQYIPVSEMLLDLVKSYPQIRLTLSLSVALLEQLHSYCPEAMESFRSLAKFPAVELIAEFDYHPISGMSVGTELDDQIALCLKLIYEEVGAKPVMIRNADLSYNDEVARRIHDLGFKGLFIQACDKIFQGRLPDRLFRHPVQKELLLLAHHVMSTHRFESAMLGKISVHDYLSQIEQRETNNLVTIGTDFATLSKGLAPDATALDPVAELFAELAHSEHYRMVTPTEAIALIVPDESTDIRPEQSSSEYENLPPLAEPEYMPDVTHALLEAEDNVKSLKDDELLRQWRMLMSNDYRNVALATSGTHDYETIQHYMDVEAIANYENAVKDFLELVNAKTHELLTAAEKTPNSVEAERRDTHQPVWAKKLENSYERERRRY